MNFFPYLLITFALTIPSIRSNSISSSNDRPITNQSIIELYKQRSKRYSHDSQHRIIGGQFVNDFRKYPFMVFVVKRNANGGGGVCGGTLISTTHVLTAAHCIPECPEYIIDYYDCGIFHNKEDFTLYFGNIVANKSKVSRKLKDIHVHHDYKGFDYTHICGQRFDIAVLELSKPVRYSQRIKAIKLPKPVTLDKDELNSTMTSSFFDTKKKCTIVGWGDNANVGDSRDPITRQLKDASVPLIGLARCINFLFKARYDSMEEINEAKKENPTAGLCRDTSICSKCPYDRSGTCIGDSGGPIICDGVQVGVNSYGTNKDCVGPNLPNVYTRVDINVQWIQSIMSNKHDRMQYEY